MRSVLNTLLFVCAMTAGVLSASAEQPPNILFIVTDDLGVSDLGCYGSDFYRTPHLDALASDGMRFTQAYAACNVCSPTRASLLTGRYPHRVRLTDALPWDRLYENPKLVPPDHLKELPLELPTFAKALREQGYRTALYGKWHLGNEYEFFVEGKHRDYGFDEAFDVSGRDKARDKGVDALTERSIQFLEKGNEGPFLLCLMHHTPHVPLASPPEEEALYESVPPGRFQKNKKYAGMISHLDQSIGMLMEALESTGLLENTVVIFTSDNGGLRSVTSNRPFRGAKGDLYEGGTRVPLIVRWPGKVAQGSECNLPVHSSDYFPTFLEVAQAELMPEAHVDGRSMLPLWKGSDEAEERRLFWHFPHRAKPSSSMIEGDWKLVHMIEPDRYELYNLERDVGESRDVAAKYPERLGRLQAKLEAHLDATGAQRMRPNPQWEPGKPKGKARNFGTFYPAEGNVFQIMKEPLPEWFQSEYEE
ncbi:sulfatase [Pelagicoccus mobilis]|uniref:Sulfatase n=1 Tax=Pelagicoccus mobilis TaxID=415221 RepID=A0A934S594_9BACT|nr:sulfatase [Pelagicoccus mobilis]MBK1879639.1 sulfatase [Pelagicoccus mobilis]